ncbi:copper resistance protein NlpE [Gillisia sp. Q332]|uniref:copper resistance protein NlpE n=1 Tax=Gillisia xinjiangensis TaxID=3384765 RepID=UPI00391D496B
MIKSILYILMLFCILSCKDEKEAAETIENTAKTESDIASEKISEIKDGHTSENSLDWEGSYSGVLPCADCEGIDTRLILRKDQTYQLKLRYLGIPEKESQDFISEGKFSWEVDGNNILLEGEKVDFQNFKVGELFLMPLDKDGNELKRMPGNNFKLLKS